MIIYINDSPITVIIKKETISYAEVVAASGLGKLGASFLIEWSANGSSGTLSAHDQPIPLINNMVFFVEDPRGYT